MKKDKVETVQLEDTQVEIESRDSVDEIRDVREEMLLEEDVGPLSLTRDFNDPNYVLYTARLNKPGWIRTLQKMGYTFVSEEEILSGELNNSKSKTVGLDSVARVELGVNKGPDPGIVMKCPREIYEKRQQLRQKINQETLKKLRPDNQNIEGSLVINGKKY